MPVLISGYKPAKYLVLRHAAGDLPIPRGVARVGRLLLRRRRQAFLVGGAVRDFLLGRPPHDWDIATDARPAEAMEIFTAAGLPAYPTGLKFGTVTVIVGGLAVEVTTFRAEAGYDDHRHPSRVSFVPRVEPDLARRDFTINALALDLRSGELLDPFGGLHDLQQGVIKAVGKPAERLREDPLRMLRAVRLAAQLGFRMDPDTAWAITSSTGWLDTVARERLGVELMKLAEAPEARRGVELLRDTGLLFVLIPELAPGWGFSQSGTPHIYTILEHQIQTLGYVPASPGVRLAALLHDVGKPWCFSRGPDGRVHFYGHDEVSAQMAGKILQRLRTNRSLIDYVVLLIREHMFALDLGPKGARRLLARVGEEKIGDLLALKLADLLATGPQVAAARWEQFQVVREQLQALISTGGAIARRDLAVNGRDVLERTGWLPGPGVGRVLQQLLEEVWEEPARNNRDYLLRRIGEIVGG